MTTQTKTVTKKPATGKRVKEAPRNIQRVHSTHYIDASNLVVGRMASLVAKKILMGHNVTIVNAQNGVFTGNDRLITALWQTRLDLRPRGNPELGPRFSCMPDRIVKEIIEGMIPSKEERGRKAMKRLRVYIGTPEGLAKQKFVGLEEAQNHRTKDIMTVLDLAQRLGYNGMK